MLRDQMAKTAQLSDFDEELYKVTEAKDKPDLDKYLIATSGKRNLRMSVHGTIALTTCVYLDRTTHFSAT